ncbi:CMGC family protein kinase [Trichomonas vaginalis G3]|uniref:cyclin-dependent kinase n=1 Tax=Trichomonas vaginalis (strain ATCC PRA-98 / G3) TaxID=412133 RepID=A2F168_TRIV3|nr:STKc CDK like domain-containing protein [Trichomonas vaginalis G3]EAY01359.1 CMGC family protein kinase [Trichomonas vaginalis G3]KAI5516669.1 STKc CDK like domain-containing protein [Trichomonas vaginalis G3]|eukprot:XP_001330212.1 CMGC family protein kinase [Trichomonas vaginalis G3]
MDEAKRYTKLEKLGEGGFGSVYRAKDEVNNNIVSMKVIPLDMEIDGITSSCLREISAMKAFDHPNIVKCLNTIVTSEKAVIISEFMEMSLRKFLCMKSPMDPELVRSYSYQMLCGIAYMHSHHYLHRDIKPENLLINRTGMLKIADFSLARSFGIPLTQMTPNVTTLWYRPPEIVLGSTFYDIGIDSWSAGCVIAEMIKKSPLFVGDSDLDQAFGIFKILGTPEEYWPENAVISADVFPEMEKKDLGGVLNIQDPDLIDLITKLLSIDPNKRLTARDALDHPYFSKISPQLADFCRPSFD